MSAEDHTPVPPFAIAAATVSAVERLTPSFARITLSGEGVDSLCTPGHTFDQRVKLIFPPDSGALPELTADGDWYRAWLDVPEAERGSMRTYSIREVSVDARGATLVVIDFVLHLEPGATGPASRWAARAAAGDRLLIVGPRRGRLDGGGIEYHPGDARRILLAGDETAAPAIARILEDSPPDTRGIAFIEVPEGADRLPISLPDGVEVRWLPRSGAAHGTALISEVLDHLGAGAAVQIRDVETEELPWETPRYSALGEEIEAGESGPDCYYWIAGESAVVTTLRRHLVKELGIERSQVAFMGYWRRGVAMKG